MASVSSTGKQAGGASTFPSISGNGRFVTFFSSARHLVHHDTNGVADVFLRDRRAHTTRRVSISSAGRQANHRSSFQSVSANGRFVVFYSGATNLVRHDANGTERDVFVYDRRTRKTERVSESTGGVQGNRSSTYPSISGNGRFVAFRSSATNLVPGDTNHATDIFVRDRRSNTTRRVSVSSTGTQTEGRCAFSAISANGRFVAFDSYASNLVTGDTGGDDVFVHDRMSGKTQRVSVSSAGTEGNGPSFEPSISANGRVVAFESRASNLVGDDTNHHFDVFAHDSKTKKTKRISVSSGGRQGNGDSEIDAVPATVVSADGRFVAFDSAARNLVRHDTNGTYDVFVHDRSAHRTRRVSVGASGKQGNGSSFAPALSADGEFVAFASGATNLVPHDHTGANNSVFVRGPLR